MRSPARFLDFAALSLRDALQLAPKKIEPGYGVRVEIAAVAALLRNDIWGVFLPDTSRQAAQGLGMTVSGSVSDFVVYFLTVLVFIDPLERK